MRRLTKRGEDGNAYFPHCLQENTCDGMGCKEEFCEFDFRVCEALTAYEDTGLEPEQIRQISKLYQEKCEELEEMKRQQGEFIKCKNCEYYGVDYVENGWCRLTAGLDGNLKPNDGCTLGREKGCRKKS